MARDTDLCLRNKVIYQVFPRQYSKSGNIKAVTEDLNRIKDLGTDILYLLPVHPIGEINRKGSLGSPYSIKNYREIDPLIGTLEDFKDLIKKTHEKGMKLIIDCVYNHTSRDSKLLADNPEFFYKNKNGEFANRVGEWWDVIDLDYSNKMLWDELIDTLVYWVKLGVDGFRCDVAPLVPHDFWMEVRKKLKEINPNIIMLSESVHLGFIKYIRDLGFNAMSDSETYDAFDILYDYDIRDEQDSYIKGGSLNDWLKAVLRQESILPKNYIKARNLDNHDTERCANYIKDETKFKNLTSLIFGLKGTAFIYAGFEALDPHRPSLFDYDYVDWSNYNKYDIVELIKKLSKIKKDTLFKDGIFEIHFENIEVAHLTYKNDSEMMELVFNLGNEKGKIKAKIGDGNYVNLINEKNVLITNGEIVLSSEPLIIKGHL